jgi:hypothetical protein
MMMMMMEHGMPEFQSLLLLLLLLLHSVHGISRAPLLVVITRCCHRGRLILALAFFYGAPSCMHARGRAFGVLHCTLMYCIVLYSSGMDLYEFPSQPTSHLLNTYQDYLFGTKDIIILAVLKHVSCSLKRASIAFTEKAT